VSLRADHSCSVVTKPIVDGQKAVAPKYEQLATEYRSVTFCKVSKLSLQAVKPGCRNALMTLPACRFAVRRRQRQGARLALRRTCDANLLFRKERKGRRPGQGRQHRSVSYHTVTQTRCWRADTGPVALRRIETALKHHSSGSATGSAFPGKGNTLSGNAPPGADGEGQVFGGVIRTIFVIAMLYACEFDRLVVLSGCENDADGPLLVRDPTGWNYSKTPEGAGRA
jgi:hypothetical protein